MDTQERNRKICERMLLFNLNKPTKIAQDLNVSRAYIYQVFDKMKADYLTESIKHAKMKSQSKNGGNK